jgi:hypothetical protein
LERMVLKGILGEVGEFENATKKRSAEWDCGISRELLN